MSHSFLAKLIPALKGSLKFQESTINTVIDGTLVFKKFVLAPISQVYFRQKIMEDNIMYGPHGTWFNRQQSRALGLNFHETTWQVQNQDVNKAILSLPPRVQHEMYFKQMRAQDLINLELELPPEHWTPIDEFWFKDIIGQVIKDKMYLERRDQEPHSLWRAWDAIFAVPANLNRNDEDEVRQWTRKSQQYQHRAKQHLPPSEGGEFLEPRGIEAGPDPRSAQKFSTVGHKWSFDHLTDDQKEQHEIKKSMKENQLEDGEIVKLPTIGMFK